MKQYSTHIDNMPKIKAMFGGYIFRRVENGVGVVKCSENQKVKIELQGIKLTEIKKKIRWQDLY